MGDCCTEHGCRRRTPILVRRAGLAGHWLVITRHREAPSGRITAMEKHVLDARSQVEIELGSSVLVDLHKFVNDQYRAAERGSAEEAAYLAVLEKLAALAEAKKTELIGPRSDRAAAS